MAPRANWKGYLKLSLVSCPIALYPAASSSERVSFRRINRKTGHRLKQQNVDAETGEVVERADTGRGYEVGKDQFIEVEDDELEQIQIESTHTIDIDRFVPAEELDKRYFDSPYYLAPTDQVGQEAFAVIRDAIRDKGMVALGRVVIARRERVVAIEALGKGLLATTLRYPYEVREADAYFEDIPDINLPKEMRDLAAHIVDTKADHFDPAKFEDHYENALVELLRQKQAGRPIEPARETRRPSNVVNLMDALKRSLAAEKPEQPETARASRKPAPAKQRRAGGERAERAERSAPARPRKAR
jgi:DNA end-binding protein Ku